MSGLDQKEKDFFIYYHSTTDRRKKKSRRLTCDSFTTPTVAGRLLCFSQEADWQREESER